MPDRVSSRCGSFLHADAGAARDSTGAVGLGGTGSTGGAGLRVIPAGNCIEFGFIQVLQCYFLDSELLYLLDLFHFRLL